MSWRFRKIFRAGPVRINLSKSGWGWSMGIPGLRYGVSAKGRRYVTYGIPGTGLYNIQDLGPSRGGPLSKAPTQPVAAPPVNTQSSLNANDPWWKQKNLVD